MKTTHSTSSTLAPIDEQPWRAAARRRMVSAEQAVAGIESGQRIFVSGNCSVPRRLLTALQRRAPALHDVELLQVLSFGEAGHVAPGMEGHIRVNTQFIGSNMRDAVAEGRADYTPIFLSELPDLYRGALRPDVALVQLSPPDEQGFCSFGVEVGVTRPAAEAATRIIAELNPHMPRTHGASLIHISRLDLIVEVDEPLMEVHHPGASPLQLAIGRHIAGLIDDGATLQVGIGGIPNAVLQAISEAGLRDLGVHTELFSDGIVDLVERGIITGARKTLHPGKIVAGFLFGSRRLYAFVDDNPLVELHPTDYVNDPFVIAQNERMVAINAALEVDLTGQVCADSLGHRLYSGVGGQVDFVRGAARSKGGRPIIALPSTARDGGISRIVVALKPGAGVVTSRNDVRYVVTEHGVAELHGKTMRQRVAALIAVAHPRFRDELTAQARAAGLL